MLPKPELDTPSDIRKMIRWPKALDKRMTHLLVLNNDGKLSLAERKELEGLVEVSQLLSMIKLRAEVLAACR